nr:hypothetical protein Iba_chr02eCG3700 [Ipomoea batatas]
MLVRRHSGSATLRQTAAGVSRIGRLSGRKRLRLAFSKWAGSPVEGDNGYSSRSVSDGEAVEFEASATAAAVAGMALNRKQERWWPFASRHFNNH